MKRNNLFKKGVVALVALLFVGLSFGGVKSGITGDFTLVRDTEILINMMRALNEHYVDTLSSSQLLRDATNGMSKSLDPYTSYIDESEMADFEILTTGKYGGIGAVIRQNNDYVVVVQPYKGSPADQGGLLIGDKIVKIDGKSAKGLSVGDVSSQLKGTPGSRVNLVMRSVIDSTDRKVTLTRQRISIPAVPYYDILDDSVGYLRHTDFTDGGFEELRRALVDLDARGMRSLILDYRGNGGGVMQEAIKVLSLFVPRGSEVLKIKGRRDSTIYRTSESPLFPNLPLVVLVNGNSASAAEIVAGALQDMDRAVLVGQRSFGKGLVQSTIPVGYDSYLKLTTARYYIPSGRCIQALDYTDHTNGREVRKMADSLRTEFSTKGGRRVLDGGGVTPDVELEAEYVSRFAATLYAQGLVEEWGEERMRRNIGERIDVKSFDISDEDYEDFTRFIEGRDVKYESKASLAIKSLERAAKEDRNEELESELKRLKTSLQDDTEDNMKRYRDEIESYLRQDIILRVAYAEGVMANSVARDKEVARAVEILTTPNEMERILEGGGEEESDSKADSKEE